MKRAALVVSLFLTVPVAEAGPWAMGRGRTYVNLSFQYLRADELTQPDGTIFDIPRFTASSLNVYGAHGLTDRLTLSANVPILRYSNLQDQPDELGREGGFGDVALGLQFQLASKGPWVFATRAMIQAPTGDETISEGLQATGSGVWEGFLVGGAGIAFGGGRGFGYLEVGYNYRAGGLRDTFVYDVQVGWNVSDRVLVAWGWRGLQPFHQEAGDRTSGSLVGLGDRVTYTRFGPEAVFKLGRGWSLQLGADAALNARNLARGPSVRGGLTWQR
jgi:hypothetical protein